ncbi:uncharacterized protein DNG_09765 [Cephalotrichum gorgonifer]|uniref:Uncharacterized protein n=1 Tax=Cephalotrichum gorgonifer TaxID=2041049 RepID=A0AAE8N6B2_9PEZI|nr:uncharacterized protein DNG_09765 [Cephalotrichum gorgonifer]
MTDVIGAASGSVALAALVLKLRAISCQFRDAPRVWHDYVSGLETLGKIQAAIPELMGEEGQSLVTIENEEGQSLSAIVFCSDKLRQVIDDAEAFLKKFGPYPDFFDRIIAKLQSFRKRVRFVLSETEIKQRLDSVTGALQMLHFAVGLTALAKSSLGHSETPGQTERLREAMQEQQNSFRLLREQIQREAPTLRLAVEREDTRSRSSSFSSLRSLRRRSLGDSGSVRRADRLVGGDLRDADNSTAPQTPGNSHHPRHHEAVSQLPNATLVDEAVITGRQSHSLTDPPRVDCLQIVEISFQDGGVVTVSFDPSQESNEGLVGSVTKNGPREAESDSENAQDNATEGYQSEAESFFDFLESAAPSEVWSDPGESSSAPEIPVRSRVGIFFPETITANHYDGIGQVFVAREPCQDISCEHSSVTGLAAPGLLDILPRRLDLDITRVRESWEDDFREVVPEGGERLAVPRRCSPPCSHTAVEVCGPSNTRCMLPFYFEALVVSPAGESSDSDDSATEHVGSDHGQDQRSELGERGGESGGNPERDDRSEHTSGNGTDGPDGEVAQEEVREKSLGPFSAVPCFHCGDDATSPKPESPSTFVTAVIYGSMSRGYRCSRCNRKMWITATKWIWE